MSQGEFRRTGPPFEFFFVDLDVDGGDNFFEGYILPILSISVGFLCVANKHVRAS